MFENLVRQVLGDLTTEAKRRLLSRLDDEAREFVSTKVADTAARGIIKSMDAVVKVAVQSLEMEEDAARFSAAYLVEIQDQMSQLSAALDDYLPHALAVERAKKAHGGNSTQANAARKVREKWMNELRGEVRDLFASVCGGEVKD